MILNPRLHPCYDVGSPLADLKAAFSIVREDDFLEEFKKFSGINHVYSTNWGRTALFIALKGMNLRKKYIAVNAYTSPIMALTIRAAGYIPIPLDINTSNLGINIDSLNKTISSDVGILIITHLFGLPDNIDALLEFAKNKDIIVIEDCANSLGSFYSNKHTGSFGDISFFSFRIGKPLSTGGGILGINNTRLLEQMLMYYKKIKRETSILSLFRNEAEKILFKRPMYGLVTKPARELCKKSYLKKILFKGSAVDIYTQVSECNMGKMSLRQSRIAHHNLKMFIENQCERERICKIYRENITKAEIPIQTPGGKCNNLFFPIILPSKASLDNIVAKLRYNNIDVSRFHHLAPSFAYGDAITEKEFSHTHILCERLINLPVLSKKENNFYFSITKLINETL